VFEHSTRVVANVKEKEANTLFLISKHSIKTIPSGKCEEEKDNGSNDDPYHLRC